MKVTAAKQQPSSTVGPPAGVGPARASGVVGWTRVKTIGRRVQLVARFLRRKFAIYFARFHLFSCCTVSHCKEAVDDYGCSWNDPLLASSHTVKVHVTRTIST